MNNLKESLKKEWFFNYIGIEGLFQKVFGCPLPLGYFSESLTISTPVKFDSDLVHKFNELTIENEGSLSVTAWDGTKGGRLILP